jgi:hypothetical protein
MSQECQCEPALFNVELFPFCITPKNLTWQTNETTYYILHLKNTWISFKGDKIYSLHSFDYSSSLKDINIWLSSPQNLISYIFRIREAYSSSFIFRFFWTCNLLCQYVNTYLFKSRHEKWTIEWVSSIVQYGTCFFPKGKFCSLSRL